MGLTKDDKEAITTFKIWVNNNTEEGVAYIPLSICENLIEVLDKIEINNVIGGAKG